jgi:hypothetical protein
MENFAEWLGTTEVSEAFKNASWFVPVVQSAHIMAIAIVFSSVLMICLRIWGWTGATQTLPDTARRYLPWIWGGAICLFLTGCLMIVTEPDRELYNPTFWTKMALVVVGLIVTAFFQRVVHRNADTWDGQPRDRMILRIAAAFSLFVWVAIIICGRLIAYTLPS